MVRICETYQQLTKALLTIPQTTQEFVQLEEFVKKTKATTLGDLQREIAEAMKRQDILLDSSHSLLFRSGKTFSWTALIVFCSDLARHSPGQLS